MGGAVVAFNLLYLFVPRGWTPYHAVVLLAPGPVTRLNGSLLIIVTGASMFLMTLLGGAGSPVMAMVKR